MTKSAHNSNQVHKLIRMCTSNQSPNCWLRKTVEAKIIAHLYNIAIKSDRELALILLNDRLSPYLEKKALRLSEKKTGPTVFN